MLCCCVSYHGLSFGTCVAVGLQELPVSYYNLWVAAGIWGFSLMGSHVFLRVVSSQYIYIYIYILNIKKTQIYIYIFNLSNNL